MTRKHVQYQLLAVCLTLLGSIIGPRQAWSDSAQDETNAIRQSILQGIRDDIQRKTRRQRDLDEINAEREKPKPPPQRASRQPSEKQ